MILLLFCLFFPLSASACHQNFVNNFCIDKKMHEKIAPYLLPCDHPMKPVLDSIFSTYGVNQNSHTLKKAGFEIIAFRPYSYIVVAKHHAMPGYLVKLYLEDEKRKKLEKEGYKWLLQRCQGAEKIRKLIKEKGLTSFVVPDKWIYPLPAKPFQTNAKCGQPFIILVTEMEIVSSDESKDIWENRATYHLLDELYILLSHGLASSYLSWNIPATMDGKFACIDTEYPKQKPNYKLARKFLSDEMAQYWDTLVKAGKCEPEK